MDMLGKVALQIDAKNYKQINLDIATLSNSLYNVQIQNGVVLKLVISQ